MAGNIYIYDSGVISLNGPLPSGANLADRSTLGSSFLAPGLTTTGSYRVSAFFPGACIYDPYSCGPGEITSVDILFGTGATLFGVSIVDQGPPGASKLSDIAVSYFYGATPESGAFPDGSGNYPSPTLPAGAQIGYNVGGARFWETAPHDPGLNTYGGIFDASAPGAPFSAPEPETWVLMLLGLGLAGRGLRRQPKARAKPA